MSSKLAAALSLLFYLSFEVFFFFFSPTIFLHSFDLFILFSFDLSLFTFTKLVYIFSVFPQRFIPETGKRRYRGTGDVHCNYDPQDTLFCESSFVLELTHVDILVLIAV